MSSITESLFGSDDPEEAARDAAEIQSQWQTEALDYLKETEEVPQAAREEAILGLQDYYQVPGQASTQEQLIAQAEASPLYRSLLESGEESALRTASATGGLRSGGSIADVQSVQNNALLQAYNQAQSREDYERSLNLQGLSGLAQLPTNQAAIAGQMGQIGQTQAQGIIAETQAGMQKNVGITNDVMDLAKMAAQFSDIRLKENIEHKGDKNGHHWYSWTWNREAEKLGLTGDSEGYMAHEVYKTRPEAIGEKDGYITVNYPMLEH